MCSFVCVHMCKYVLLGIEPTTEPHRLDDESRLIKLTLSEKPESYPHREDKYFIHSSHTIGFCLHFVILCVLPVGIYVYHTYAFGV